jgi:hypothetical protein
MEGLGDFGCCESTWDPRDRWAVCAVPLYGILSVGNGSWRPADGMRGRFLPHYRVQTTTIHQTLQIVARDHYTHAVQPGVLYRAYYWGTTSTVTVNPKTGAITTNAGTVTGTAPTTEDRALYALLTPGTGWIGFGADPVDTREHYQYSTSVSRTDEYAIDYTTDIYISHTVSFNQTLTLTNTDETIDIVTDFYNRCKTVYDALSFADIIAYAQQDQEFSCVYYGLNNDGTVGRRCYYGAGEYYAFGPETIHIDYNVKAGFDNADYTLDAVARLNSFNGNFENAQGGSVRNNDSFFIFVSGAGDWPPWREWSQGYYYIDADGNEIGAGTNFSVFIGKIKIVSLDRQNKRWLFYPLNPLYSGQVLSANLTWIFTDNRLTNHTPGETNILGYTIFPTTISAAQIKLPDHSSIRCGIEGYEAASKNATWYKVDAQGWVDLGTPP